MALRFIDGFEHYSIPSQLPMKWTSYANSGISTMTGRRAGTTALRLNYTGDTVSLTLDAQSSWVMGFAFCMFGNETQDLIRFYDPSDGVQLSISIGSDGTIRLYRSTSTLLVQSTNALSIGVWNYIEIKFTVADSGGTFEVRVNESVWATYTGDTKQSTSLTTVSRFQIYGRTSDCAFDDLYICDTTGAVNNNYLGDCRIDTIYPNGVGNVDDFTPQGATTNWEAADETAFDGDTSYNYSNTVSAKDTFAFTNVPAITGTIFGVQANVGARKDDAGARVLRALARLASTDYESVDMPLATDYLFARNIWQTNPNTSAAWAEADINGAEFGYKIQS